MSNDNLPNEAVDEGPDCQTRDAWNQSFDLVQGLDELFWLIAGAQDGIGMKAGYALTAISTQLRDQMRVVNNYFNPDKSGEGGAA